MPRLVFLHGYICAHTNIYMGSTELGLMPYSKFTPSFIVTHKHPLEHTEKKEKALNKMEVN